MSGGLPHLLSFCCDLWTPDGNIASASASERSKNRQRPHSTHAGSVEWMLTADAQLQDEVHVVATFGFLPLYRQQDGPDLRFPLKMR